MRAVLLEYPPYGPWEVEALAVERAGGRLVVLPYERFAAEPVDTEMLLNVYAGPLPPAALDRMPSLRCAVSYGVGLDWIDVGEATRRGVLVVNMPTANIEDVAIHAFALILACARRLLELDRTVRAGEFDWPRSKPLHRLRGRRLGLLAFGNIPRILARLADPVGLRVAAYDPYVAPATVRAQGVEPMELEPLLQSADVLSVHLPSTPETRRLLDERRLRLLPAGAIVVVTSRGDVYDADALQRALESGHLAAAGLDVFPEEPLPADHALTSTPNVVLTPHVAGYSEESIRDLHETAAAVVSALARGDSPPGLVNPDALGGRPL